MTKQTLFLEDGKTIDQILLSNLNESGLLSEAKTKLAKASVLIEESIFLRESSDINRITVSRRLIDRDVFHVVYSDVNQYPDQLDVLLGLQYSIDDFSRDPKKRKDTVRKILSRIIKEFNEGRTSTSTEEFPLWSQRKNFYIKRARKAGGFEEEIEEPNFDDIDAGSRSKSDRVTRAIGAINKRELLNGEFYANMTRIPKSRWGGWLRFWDKEKTSVAQDKTLLGRRWAKTFVLGYQVERRVVYEIWYNSIDSTFTVHDINGIDTSARVRTMNEAVRNTIRLIAQQSDEDAEIFAGSSPEARLLSRSIEQSITSNADPRVKELRELDTKVAAQAKAEKLAERQDREKRQAQIRASVKNSFAKSKEAFEKASEVAAEMAKEQADDVMTYGPEAARKAKDFAKQAGKTIKDVVDYQPYHGTQRDDKVNMRQGQNDPQATQQDVKTAGAQKHNKLNKAVMNKVRKATAAAKKSIDPVEDKMDKMDKTNKSREAELKRKLAMIKKAEEDNRRLFSSDENTITESFQNQLTILESFQDFAEMEELDDDIQRQTQSKTYDREIERIRSTAERSPYTASALRDTIMGQVETYDETRVQKHFPPSLFGGALFRGRREPIRLPTDKPDLFRRAKMALYGQRFRADFVIGFTLADKVDVEVWYITEPNPDYGSGNKKKTIASFYVFDISSGKLLRRYLPYYRNALPVVMAKIGMI